ncbi:uncharacterized protein [Triticum aestivum]|uniref:uncharacterized protein n=1 Tax=Triticum aestivum TaxID=4565 RepID=UPI001D034AE0|nr:uncharacterized protein LOC123078426 [Triticum aestivum]XP_044356870.1 uncharacterized protein LOC123078426 [Triticum aestivum]
MSWPSSLSSLSTAHHSSLSPMQRTLALPDPDPSPPLAAIHRRSPPASTPSLPCPPNTVACQIHCIPHPGLSLPYCTPPPHTASRNKGLASLRPDPIGASLASDQACTTRVPPPGGVDSCVLRLRVLTILGVMSSRSPLCASVPIWFALSPALMRPVLHTQVHERPRLHSKAIRAGVDWRARTRWMDGGDTDLLRRVSQEAAHPAATTSTARRWWPTSNATAASPVTSSQWQPKQEPRLLLV